MLNLRTLGKYRIIAELGHGGMAEVFLAMVAGPVGTGFSKLAVVKRLRPDLVEDPAFVTMLVDEARISARLNHPNVVQTLEVDFDQGEYFIAMEFLDGQPLHRILRRSQRQGIALSPAHQYVIVADALAGLQHAHELTDYDGTPMGIVHRDVTPQNLFVTYDGQVKVVDFGIAKAEGRASETKQGIVKGKVRYMSPEQAAGGDVDCRSDIFAAGVLLWEAATGRRFWEGVDQGAVVDALISGEFDPSPRSVDPSVPAEVDAMCVRALAFAARDRYASAADFRADLETFLADDVVGARRGLGPLVCQLFAAERRKVREVIEQTSRGNVAPMSLVTFTAATAASQAWSTPSIAPAPVLHVSTMPPPPNAGPSIAPVMLVVETQNCLASDEELGSDEPEGSRAATYLAALALAASLVLAFTAPRLALLSSGAAGSGSGTAREASEVVGARTTLAARDVARGKRGVREHAASTTQPPHRDAAAHEVREAAAPQPQHTVAQSSSPTAAAPTSATLVSESKRRKAVLDTADPWSAAH